MKILLSLLLMNVVKTNFFLLLWLRSVERFPIKFNEALPNFRHFHKDFHFLPVGDEKSSKINFQKIKSNVTKHLIDPIENSLFL